MIRTLALWLLFKATWYITVQGAATSGPWPGAAAALAWLAGAVYLLRPGRAGLLRWTVIAGLGGACEALLHGMGIVDYPAPSDAWALGPLPLWILGLWLILATLLSSKLAIFAERPTLAAVIGAVGGPCSFWVGSRFGATSLGPDPALAVAAIALEWLLLLPLCARLAQLPPNR